jgi:hypothetical protein
MSTLLQECAGTVHVVAQGSAGGFYSIRPALPSSGDAKCIITGIPVNYDEIFQPSVTIDDQRAIFVFGSAWSSMTLTGILLLGPDKSGGVLANQLLEWYEQNKLSAREDSVSLSVSSKGIEAYVVGIQLGAANADNNKQEFAIKFLVSKE